MVSWLKATSGGETADAAGLGQPAAGKSWRQSPAATAKDPSNESGGTGQSSSQARLPRGRDEAGPRGRRVVSWVWDDGGGELDGQGLAGCD